jgi:hypothetical protein
MNDLERNRILSLGDVDLVRLLTVDAAAQTADVIEFATDEAKRRGLPVDEAFLPEQDAASRSANAQRWVAAGRVLVCPHCQHDRFHRRSVLQNTRGMTFLRLDWANRGVDAMECQHCGLVQTFTTPPRPAEG